jgi:hypothetical protein
MHRGLPLVFVGLALALTACDEAAVVAVGEEPKCSGAPASPLKTERVLEALEQEGIDAFPEERSSACVDDSVVASVTNVMLDEETPAGQGNVFCTVYRKRAYGNRLEEETDRGLLSLGGETDFWLANLDCSVYPHGDDEDAQIARLRRAMEALEASL